jgi:hypothetical protein
MVAAPPPQMAITPYIFGIWPRPLPTIMRRDSTPQGRQFKPVYVPRNQDLVELWVDMVADPPPGDQCCLHLPPFTAASTTKYAPG